MHEQLKERSNETLLAIYGDRLAYAILSNDYQEVRKMLNNNSYRGQLLETIRVPAFFGGSEFEIPRFALASTPGIFKLVVNNATEEALLYRFGPVFYVQLLDDEVRKLVPDFINDEIGPSIDFPGEDMYHKYQNIFVNYERGYFIEDVGYTPDNLMLFKPIPDEEEDEGKSS